MQAAAIAQILIAVLPFVETGVEDFVKWINTFRSDAQAQNQWTDVQEASFRAAVFAKTSDPAYLPDQKPPPPPPTPGVSDPHPTPPTM